jgi:nucleoside-diphosphate-sugar epimerase
VATLITGAGLVGGHTARLLQQQGETVVFADVNPDPRRLDGIVDPVRTVVERVHMGDLPELIRLVRTHGVSRIVHTAALTSDVWVHPYRGTVENVAGIANVLEVARLEGVQRVVLSSSASVYGSGPDREPVAEDSTCAPGDVYGVTKLTAELLGRTYERRYGIEFVALRYPVVIPPVSDGFRTAPNTDIARFGYAVPGMVEAAVAGEPYRAADWPRMEWGWCQDIAMGTYLAATHAHPPSRVYNLGAGCASTLADFAAALRARVGGARIDIEDASTSGIPIDPAAHALDIARARVELGYRPEVTSPEQLVDTLLSVLQPG